MKKNIRKSLGKTFLLMTFSIFISVHSFSQIQKNSEPSMQNAQFKTIIIKAYGIKSDDVFLRYKNFLTGLKGVSVKGHTLANEYLLIEIDTGKIQFIDVLQPLKDSGYVFDFLYDDPTAQKLQELFANDPLIN